MVEYGDDDSYIGDKDENGLRTDKPGAHIEDR